MSVTDDLFRVYYDDPDALYVLADGYPREWHGPNYRIDVGTEPPFWSTLPERYRRHYEPGQVTEFPGIKHLVREDAGHRCVRCLHPYVVGDTPGEWSPCDDECAHQGPLRVLYGGGGQGMEPETWRYYDTWARDPDHVQIGVDVVVEAQWRVLTVHHLNGVKADCRWWNLVALCQRCHLTIQAKVRVERPWNREHSDWFKPYVAGYYAWAFLGEELNREQVAARMDELLALASPDQGLFPDVDRRY